MGHSLLASLTAAATFFSLREHDMVTAARRVMAAKSRQWKSFFGFIGWLVSGIFLLIFLI